MDLFKLLELGRIRKFMRCVQRWGADIHQKDSSESTLLMYAASYGYLPIVRYLIKHGLDIHVKNENGATAVMWSTKHIKVLKYLFGKGANIHETSKYEKSMLTHVRSLEVIKFLIEHGLDVDSRGIYGNGTPLIYASEHGRLETVKYLIEKGANINIIDGMDWNALIYAARYNQLDVVKYLVEKGANVHYRDNSGDTALDRVARHLPNYDAVREFLISKGGDLSEELIHCCRWFQNKVNQKWVYAPGKYESTTRYYDSYFINYVTVGRISSKNTTPFTMAIKHCPNCGARLYKGETAPPKN